MRGSTGCFEYTGLYKVSQVLGALFTVSNMEVSAGCLKYRGLVVSSMEVSTGCIYKYMVFYRVSKYGTWILH